jgi:hypothetical protein
MFIGCSIISFRSQESVVGIATSYGLDDLRFESRQEQIILSKNPAGANYSFQKLSPSFLFNGYQGSSPCVKRPGT